MNWSNIQQILGLQIAYSYLNVRMVAFGIDFIRPIDIKLSCEKLTPYNFWEGKDPKRESWTLSFKTMEKSRRKVKTLLEGLKIAIGRLPCGLLFLDSWKLIKFLNFRHRAKFFFIFSSGPNNWRPLRFLDVTLNLVFTQPRWTVRPTSLDSSPNLAGRFAQPC